jgi:hypothetical protein
VSTPDWGRSSPLTGLAVVAYATWRDDMVTRGLWVTDKK